MPPGMKARLWNRLGNQLATMTPRTPVTEPVSRATSPGGSPAGAAGAKTFTWAKLLLVSLGVVGTGVGVAVGVGGFGAMLQRRSSPPPPKIVPQPSPRPDEGSPPPAGPPRVSVMQPPRGVPVRGLRAYAEQVLSFRPARLQARPPSTRFSDAPADDLAAERSLIARARTSLQGGSPLDALATLQLHENQFRTGALAQEREALRVQALMASGNRAAAETAAAHFERQYPRGLMEPAVAALDHAP